MIESVDKKPPVSTPQEPNGGEAAGTRVPIRTHTVSSVPEYLQVVFDTLATWRGHQSDCEIWFRGQSKSSHPLLPGAYRGNWDEASMYNRFFTEAALLMDVDVRPSTLWEWYFASQHYGLPTRLLDWSEDPLCGLFFAVRGDHPDTADLTTKWVGKDPPTVWVIEPSTLNHACHESDCVFVPEDTGELTPLWLPDHLERGAGANELPIAVHPACRTRRIQAQSGKFTVHGTSSEALDVRWGTLGLEAGRAGHLFKIEVADVEGVSRQLFDIGYTRVRLFPEPNNLADHIKRLYRK